MAVDYGALKTSEAAQAKGMGIKTQTEPGLAKQKRKNSIAEAAQSPDEWLDESDEELDWIYEDLIYKNTVTIVDSIGGSGKTTLGMQIGIGAALGLPFMGLSRFKYSNPEPARVLYLNGEDPRKILKKRFRAICARHAADDQLSKEQIKDAARRMKIVAAEDCGHNLCLVGEDGRATVTNRDLCEFADDFRPDIIFIDSLINFYGADENRSSHGRAFYSLLLKLGATVIIMHHQNKAALNGGDLSAASRGTMVFREQARTRLCLVTDRESKDKHIEIEKMNYAPTAGIKISISYDRGAWKAATEDMDRNIRRHQAESDRKRAKKQQKQAVDMEDIYEKF